MYTTINVTSMETAEEIDINDATYPLEKFAWEPSMSGTNPKRLFGSGSWDGHSNVKDMAIDLEGHILADTTENYWTARKALMAIMLPHPDQIDRNHVMFTLTLDDSSEIFAVAQLETVSAPTEAFYPTVTPFMFGYTVNYGYWRDVSTGDVVYV